MEKAILVYKRWSVDIPLNHVFKQINSHGAARNVVSIRPSESGGPSTNDRATIVTFIVSETRARELHDAGFFTTDELKRVGYLGHMTSTEMKSAMREEFRS